ncbi:hypothetical protein [Lederbergia lenta]|uniref:hypothetical protein n=1 Tax=Lederbergia lenta TaxID=1467 RepID=UPI00203F1DB1|nr:hypothetical protein [Lederbergia lenta]MCM3111973.1 hypothetical protein [Lederbergia lenta]
MKSKKILVLSIINIFLLLILLLKALTNGIETNEITSQTEELETDKIITQSLFDEWYHQDQLWSIDQFPGNGLNYKGHQYAWGWSYVANSLIDMYKATGDEKYLEILIPQVEYIFTQTDEKLGIESFSNTGLSLPAWSDGGHYTIGKFNYIYPVHTGMIILPILRFVDSVKEDNISRFNSKAEEFLRESAKSLAIHNHTNMWIDISETEGFYRGHPYGQEIVSEANKIGIPNRIFAYLAAAGMYDKITGGSVYTPRINKSLEYFKNYLLKYDEKSNSYYWSYWEYLNKESWEDISHAAVTIYGIFILNKEAGFTTFTNEDFVKFSNIVNKLVKDDQEDTPPKVMKYIKANENEEQTYFDKKENPYYYSVLRWSFLGIYDKKVLNNLEGVYLDLYHQNVSSSSALFSVASYLYTKKQLSD